MRLKYQQKAINAHFVHSAQDTVYTVRRTLCTQCAGHCVAYNLDKERYEPFFSFFTPMYQSCDELNCRHYYRDSHNIRKLPILISVYNIYFVNIVKHFH